MKKIITIGFLATSMLFAAMQTHLPSGATKLAYQEDYDAILGNKYAYLAYITKSKKSIKIQGLGTASTVMTNKTCTTKIRYNRNHTGVYFVVGFDGLSEKNSPDARMIEHRIYCDKNTGKATKVEMILQVRDASGKAKKQHKVSFDWPL